MGWISATGDLSNNEKRQYYGDFSGGGVTPSPFDPCVPEQVKVILVIADHRFEREISKKQLIWQGRGEARRQCVDLSPSPLEEIPDELLQGVPREAFIAKWKTSLGDTWGCMFEPQEDGSYAANGIFLKNVADIVWRAKKS